MLPERGIRTAFIATEPDVGCFMTPFDIEAEMAVEHISAKVLIGSLPEADRVDERGV